MSSESNLSLGETVPPAKTHQKPLSESHCDDDYDDDADVSESLHSHCGNGEPIEFPIASTSTDLTSETSSKSKDVDESSIESEKSTSVQDPREGSPLKEAIKSFVRNRLVKKGTNEASRNSQPGEKRTLLSGLKDKVAKRLEESVKKEPLEISEEVKAPALQNDLAENDQNLKVNNELKSVVANDVEEPVTLVDQGEECFEEPKFKSSSSRHAMRSDDDAAKDYLSLPVSTPPRSKTMSHIAATAQMLKSKLTNDKNMSISFSDLQRSEVTNDIADVNNYANSDAGPSTSSVQDTNVSTSTEVSQGTATPLVEIQTEQSPPEEAGGRQNALRRFGRRLWSLIIHLQVHVLVLVVGYFTYKVLNNYPFLSGMMFGMLIISFILILYYDLTLIIIDGSFYRTPQYKTLASSEPSTSEDHSLLDQSAERRFQGWMNLLKGDYDPDHTTLMTTTSVFVCVEGSVLTLSHPKKPVPKNRTAHEKPVQAGPFLAEEHYLLHQAKVVFLPENISRNRIFNKRYPLCIFLPQGDLSRRRSVHDLPDLNAADVDRISIDVASINSLPVSLPGSPAHRPPRERTTIVLFARSSREKEEWYWALYNAIHADSSSQSRPSDISTDSTSFYTLDSSSLASGSQIHLPEKIVVSDSEYELPSTSRAFLKPHLDFNEYMKVLFKQKGRLSSPHVQWVNILLGRLFYDFLVLNKYTAMVKEKIQHKLSRIEMPQYMDKLVVTDVYVGTALPQLLEVASEPVLDERGVWFFFKVEYKGYFQMTLETKFRSLLKQDLERKLAELPEISDVR